MIARATAAAYGHVGLDQRFRRGGDCPICAGGDSVKRHRGERCAGFLSDDGEWAFCTRDEFAGNLPLRPTSPPSYKHRLNGPCHCGQEHGAALIQREPIPEAARAPGRTHLRQVPTAIYAYRALETGAPLRKLRYGTGKNKWFVWQRPDGGGDWINGQGGATPDAYGAESLVGTDPFEPLAIVEGEKDRDLLHTLGWRLVISPPDGKNSWDEAYSHYATGRNVVIFADKDSDGGGQEHAEQVAASVAPCALTVRVVLFDDAHDVGDWITAGHTLAELRALAAATPVITAQLPPSQNSNRARQDDTRDDTRVAMLRSCPSCRQWAERARIAETSLANARQELANLRNEMAVRATILAAPKEQFSPALKTAAIAVRTILTQSHKPRDEEGRAHVWRAQLAKMTGVSEQTAGASLAALHEKGFIKREIIQKGFQDTELRISEGPLFNEPEKIATTEKTWGGRRVKTCVACGSDNLEVSVVCRDCGTVQSREDVNKPADDVEDDPESPDGGNEPPSQNSNRARQDDTRADMPADPSERGLLEEGRLSATDLAEGIARLPQRQDHPLPLYVVSNLDSPEYAERAKRGERTRMCSHPPQMLHTLRNGAIACGACGERRAQGIGGDPQ